MAAAAGDALVYVWFFARLTAAATVLVWAWDRWAP